MTRGAKSELKEILEELGELDGKVRPLEVVFLRHLANTDFALRHSASLLHKDVSALIDETPAVPPNADLLDCLRRLNIQIRRIADANAAPREQE